MWYKNCEYIEIKMCKAQLKNKNVKESKIAFILEHTNNKGGDAFFAYI